MSFTIGKNSLKRKKNFDQKYTELEFRCIKQEESLINDYI